MKYNKFNTLKLFYFFSGLVFYSPVAILVRTTKGISISEFLILQGILSVSILIFEIPMGFLTDKIGYKKSLIFSQIFIFVARIILLFATNFSLFVFEAILEGISFALGSGTSSSYLYSILPEDKYMEKSASLFNYSTAGFILSILLFPIFNAIGGINLLVITTIICNFIAILFMLNIPKENEIEKYDIGIKSNYLNSIFTFKTIEFVVLNSLISIAFILINFFYATILEKLDISVNYMSVVIITYSLIDMLIPYIIRNIGEKNIYKKISFIFIISSVFIFLISKLNNILVFLPMIVLPMLISLLGSFVDKAENMYIDRINIPDKRATTLSLFSMGSNTFDVTVLFASSILIDDNFNILFTIFSVLFFVVGLVLFMVNLKQINKTKCRNIC